MFALVNLCGLYYLFTAVQQFSMNSIQYSINNRHYAFLRNLKIMRLNALQ